MTVQYHVFVQSLPDNSYVAAVIGMPDCVVEGKTREETIEKARAALAARLAQGEVVTIEVESPDIARPANPWLDNFGRLKDDPTFDDFLSEIEACRRESVEACA